MKRFITKMVLGLLVGLFLSCASTSSYTYNPLSKLPNANVLGMVQVKFETPLGYEVWDSNSAEGALARNLITAPIALGIATGKTIKNLSIREKISEAAHTALLEEAKKEHTGNIDVADITFTEINYNQQTELYEYEANGTVVLIGEIAHTASFEEATKEYDGNIDVADITFSENNSNQQTELYEYEANETAVLIDE
jgi:SepF-like predicted cell division protein (DUF552 family)